MPTATISSRLTANGLQQHLHAEPTSVQENCHGGGGSCGCPGDHCFFDSACCPGHICELWNCREI